MIFDTKIVMTYSDRKCFRGQKLFFRSLEQFICNSVETEYFINFLLEANALDQFPIIYSLDFFSGLRSEQFLQNKIVKFIYSEKATKFCEIFTLLLSYVVPVKSKVKISKIFVAF